MQNDHSRAFLCLMRRAQDGIFAALAVALSLLLAGMIAGL